MQHLKTPLDQKAKCRDVLRTQLQPLSIEPLAVGMGVGCKAVPFSRDCRTGTAGLPQHPGPLPGLLFGQLPVWPGLTGWRAALGCP